MVSRLGFFTYAYFFSLTFLICTVPFLLKHLKQIVLEMEYLTPRTNWALCIPPFLLSVMSMMYSQMITTTQTFFNMVFITLMLSTGLATYLVTFRMITETSKQVRLREELRNMEWLLNVQQNNYSNIMENRESLRKLRHDMRHHLVSIRSLYNQPESLLKYLDKMDVTFPLNHEIEYCENEAVNAVTNHYLSIARKESTQLDIRFDIPSDIGGISPSDLCVLLGNLLENAVEAGKFIPSSERYLKVFAHVKNERLIIIVDNHFDGTYREENGTFFSRKRATSHSDLHTGIGISSIRAICKKYNGFVKFEIVGNTFQASALLDMSNKTIETAKKHLPFDSW